MATTTKTARKSKTANYATSLSIRANAGTGKTTTIEWVEKGVPKGIKLSDQQAAIIDTLKMPAAQRKKNKVRFSCFNVSIKNELAARLPDAECVTNNGLGHQTILKALNLKYAKPDTRKYFWLLKDRIGNPYEDRSLWPIITSLQSIIDMVRVTLTGQAENGYWHVSVEDIRDMIANYSMDVENYDYLYRVEELINEGTKLAQRGKIDFNDQVFLPEVLGVAPPKVFRNYVDECQDLNCAQRNLLLKAAEHSVIVGDQNQSIYLFNGADPSSMPMFEQSLVCPTLPLSITRRCPKRHVELAKRFLPEDTLFAAHEDNIDGTIEYVPFNDELYSQIVKNEIENLFLSRTNAPLVSACFSCYKSNIPASIRGRDFAQQAIKKIKNAKGETNAEILTELMEAFEKKIANYSALGKDDMVNAVQDEAAVFTIFLSETATPADAIKRMEEMFDGERLAKGIKFSTVHKAKGLEAHTVGILTPELLPHPGISRISPQWATQERNIAYVAYTRGKNTLLINKK